MVAESNFVGHSSTVAHSTLEANSGMHYDTSRVVLVLELFARVHHLCGLGVRL